MQLYLIRHAESENNAKPEHDRVEDPMLTAVGRLQAAHLAEWLRTLRMDALITSPVRRALQTTRYIADTSGQHVHIWANVFEEGGIYRGHGPEAIEGGPGLPRSDVIRCVGTDATGCTLDATIVESGWWGGRNRETPAEATERAATVAHRLIETFGSSGQTVVAVIHADFKRKLLIEMMGQPLDSRAFGSLRNTGISRLNFDGRGWQLDWFNSVSHLPAKLITGHAT